MSDLGAQLNQLTPEQRQAIMMKAQQEANEQVMQEMMKRMTSTCFEKCAGTSVRQLSGCEIRPAAVFLGTRVNHLLCLPNALSFVPTQNPSEVREMRARRSPFDGAIRTLQAVRVFIEFDFISDLCHSLAKPLLALLARLSFDGG